jgi:predicted metal-dependent HD superfamily phosphohydrolase
MATIGKKIVKTSYYESIRAMYADPRRVYHGLGHIAYQFNLIEQLLPKLPEQDREYSLDFLFNASLFHDCYYEYGMALSFNEEVSAEFASHHISQFDQKLAADVTLTIFASAHYLDKNKQRGLVSQTHNPKLAMLFLDIDLHSMQSAKYDQAIKQEALNYGVTEEDYVKGRYGFIDAMQTRINDENGFPKW